MCDSAMCDAMIYIGVMTERAGKRWIDRERERERVNEWERDRKKVNWIAAVITARNFEARETQMKKKKIKQMFVCLGVFQKMKKKKLRAAVLHSPIQRARERESFECPISQSDFLWRSLAHWHTHRDTTTSSHTHFFSLQAQLKSKLLLQFTVWCVCWCRCCCRHCHSLCHCNCEKAPRYQSTVLCVPCVHVCAPRSFE